MPQRLPLIVEPNQSLTVQLEDFNYEISLRATRGVMSATIVRDDVVLVSNVRIVSDAPLIPYEYLEGRGGNFIFTTELDSLPAFAAFDVTQFLFYLTAEEVSGAR